MTPRPTWAATPSPMEPSASLPSRICLSLVLLAQRLPPVPSSSKCSHLKQGGRQAGRPPPPPVSLGQADGSTQSHLSLIHHDPKLLGSAKREGSPGKCEPLPGSSQVTGFLNTQASQPVCQSNKPLPLPEKASEIKAFST